MSRHLRHISSVALATAGSRVLGLIRDVLTFAVLGTGTINSAFVLAFTIPNLFRRLLGEGALTSALVPVLSDYHEKLGQDEAYGVLNRVLSRLIILLLAIVIGSMLILLVVLLFLPVGNRWELGMELTMLLLPYLWFICLAAIVTAFLNILERFLVPALGPVVLNVVMILALAVAAVRSDSQIYRVLFLCVGVLLGGVLQWWLPWHCLRKEGWKFRLDLRVTDDWHSIMRLFVPGLMGAAIFQVNILVSRLIAYGLNESAAGILYLANRLVELPLGVFAIAISTVYFPQLARSLARDDLEGFARSYTMGLRLIFAITLPAAAGLIVLAEPILTALFEWGLFGSADVEKTVLPLAVFAFGMPLYGWATLTTRALHSLKEMRFPVKIGAVNAVLNIGLSLILMQWLSTAGLALANVIAAVVFAVLLERGLRARVAARSHNVRVEGISRPLWIMGISVALMAAAVGALRWALENYLSFEDKAEALLIVGACIPAGIVCYAGCLRICRLEEFEMIRNLVRKRVR